MPSNMALRYTVRHQPLLPVLGEVVGLVAVVVGWLILAHLSAVGGAPVPIQEVLAGVPPIGFMAAAMVNIAGYLGLKYLRQKHP